MVDARKPQQRPVSADRLRFLARGDTSPTDASELLAQLAFRTSVLEAQADAVNEGLLLVGPSGEEIISYNRRFAEQWGFDEDLLARKSDEAALGEAVTRLVDQDAFLARVQYLYEHPEESSVDVLTFQDGRVLERFSAPVRGSDGTYYGRLWAFRDITETVRVQQSLARRAAEQAALYRFTDQLHRATTLDEVYRSAIDAILEAVACDRASLLLFDEALVMRFVAWRGLSEGYRRAVDGHTPWRADEKDALPIAVDDVAGSDLDEELKATVLGEGIRAFAFIPLATSDRLIGKFMVYYDAPHAFSDEALSLALTIARQITFGILRKRADEDRARAEAALRAADQRKDEFLATLAHELRNPLAPVRNVLPLLQAKLADGEDVTRHLEMLFRQTSRLSRMVDDLMDVSRITRGHIDLRFETVDLVSVVNRALDLAAEEPGADELAFSVELPAVPVPILGDSIRLEQIVHNLLSNAIKYTDVGGSVSVAVVPLADSVEVRVRDTGIGLDVNTVEQIFDLFHQGDRSLDRSAGGLGIGLTVARRLVELHGGQIEVSSDGLGSGAEFTVRLPRHGGLSEGAGAAEAPVSSWERRTGRSVLIVDDNRDQTEVLAELVERLGHQPSVAHNGVEALRLASERKPDVVLLDLGLPELSGYEIAERLRKDPANRSMVLVAVTGYGQPSDRERSAQSGFDAHIVKPIELDVLEFLLDTGRAPDTAAPRRDGEVRSPRSAGTFPQQRSDA